MSDFKPYNGPRREPGKEYKKEASMDDTQRLDVPAYIEEQDREVPMTPEETWRKMLRRGKGR